jgi:hypothetical protein
MVTMTAIAATVATGTAAMTGVSATITDISTATIATFTASVSPASERVSTS